MTSIFSYIMQVIFSGNSDVLNERTVLIIKGGANEYNNFLKSEGENCYKPSGNGCFLKCSNYVFKEDFTMEFFEFIQIYKIRTNVMTRCRIPELCERYKKTIGI